MPDGWPDAIGLAVPGMPIGSPVMDGPAHNGRVQPYDVLLLTKGGDASLIPRAQRLEPFKDVAVIDGCIYKFAAQ